MYHEGFCTNFAIYLLMLNCRTTEVVRQTVQWTAVKMDSVSSYCISWSRGIFFSPTFIHRLPLLVPHRTEFILSYRPTCQLWLDDKQSYGLSAWLVRAIPFIFVDFYPTISKTLIRKLPSVIHLIRGNAKNSWSVIFVKRVQLFKKLGSVVL